ncbi:hypothetical protein JCM10207_000121 [Rhodosporidiobolus poonsookiae]
MSLCTDSISVRWRIDGIARLLRDIKEGTDEIEIVNSRKDGVDYLGVFLQAKTYGNGVDNAILDDASYVETSTLEDYIIIKCTIACTPALPTLPLHPVPPNSTTISKSLCSTHGLFFEVPALTDIAFGSVKPGGRIRYLRAHRALLAKRVPYYRTMFASGFRETNFKTSASFVFPDSTPTAARSSSLLAFDDDDDTLEWLPQSWLNLHGPEKPETDAASRAEIEDAGHIHIPEGYITFRAFLYYLHTDTITFTPSPHNFTVELCKSPKGKDAFSSHTSRRAFLLEQMPKKGHPVEPASAHAVYALADKLLLKDLKKLAGKAIVEGFTVDNILYELVSSFSDRYEAIQQEALEFAWENWAEVRKTTALNHVLDVLCSGKCEIEGAAEIWKTFLGGLNGKGKRYQLNSGICVVS